MMWLDASGPNIHGKFAARSTSIDFNLTIRWLFTTCLVEYSGSTSRRTLGGVRGPCAGAGPDHWGWAALYELHEEMVCIRQGRSRSFWIFMRFSVQSSLEGMYSTKPLLTKLLESCNFFFLPSINSTTIFNGLLARLVWSYAQWLMMWTYWSSAAVPKMVVLNSSTTRLLEREKRVSRLHELNCLIWSCLIWIFVGRLGLGQAI